MRKWLKDRREMRQLSQQQVANSLGVSRQYYQQIEAGDRQQKMDVSIMVKLSEILGISIIDIAEFEKDFFGDRIPK